MNTFNPEKLSVEFIEPTTPLGPLIPRRYTLTHSDSTGELYLDIGDEYNWSKFGPLRDEVLGEWKQYDSSLFYQVLLYLDQGEFPLSSSKRRNEIFRRELPLALDAIKYGDQFLFDVYPFLEHAPIVVHFVSSYPELSKQELWGTYQKISAPK